MRYIYINQIPLTVKYVKTTEIIEMGLWSFDVEILVDGSSVFSFWIPLSYTFFFDLVLYILRNGRVTASIIYIYDSTTKTYTTLGTKRLKCLKIYFLRV